VAGCDRQIVVRCSLEHFSDLHRLDGTPSVGIVQPHKDESQPQHPAQGVLVDRRLIDGGDAGPDGGAATGGAVGSSGGAPGSGSGGRSGGSGGRVGGSGGAPGTGGGPLMTDGGVLIPSGVHVQYRCTQAQAMNATSVGIDFAVQNMDPIPLDLTTFTLRYWLTLSGEAPVTVALEQIQPSVIQKTDVKVSMKTVDPPRTGADTYIEVGFGPNAGGIGYMGQLSQITVRMQGNYPGFTQTNDYSFDSTVTSFKDYKKVTAYVDGTLIWGTEP